MPHACWAAHLCTPAGQAPRMAATVASLEACSAARNWFEVIQNSE